MLNTLHTQERWRAVELRKPDCCLAGRQQSSSRQLKHLSPQPTFRNVQSSSVMEAPKQFQALAAEELCLSLVPVDICARQQLP